MNNEGSSSKPFERANKKRSFWAVVLPFAACLILLAFVGAFVFNLSNHNPQEQIQAATTNDAVSPSTQNASKSEGGTESEAPNESDYTHRFPVIELKAGNQLHIVTTDGSVPLIVDETKIGQELGSATAKSEDGVSSINCTVYEYHDEKYPYAICYGSNPIYHLAIPDKDETLKSAS